MQKLREIAGCVILFNPEDDVLDNVLSYINSVSVLIVIDNSTSYNICLIQKIKSYNNVHYVNNECNLGVATALNTAADIALSQGFKWILTMDQDSYIDKRFFNIVSPFLSNNQNIIVAANYNGIFYKPRKSSYEGFFEIGTVITSGNLLNLDGWKSVGGFNEKLFIDEVDNEFCIRAIKNGFRILSTSCIYLKHNLGSKYSKINLISRKQLNFSKHSPVRVYYMTRNNLFLWKNYFFTNPGLVWNRMKNLIKLFFEITFYYPDKASYYRNMFKGARHFLQSRYGRI